MLPPSPTTSPALPGFHLLIAKAFWHGNVFVKKRGLDSGHLSKEDAGTRTLLQLISKCLAPAFGQRIDLHKATSRDEFASLHSPLRSPCPASIRHATGFQTDSVSDDNQIRDESLRGLPRGRKGGEGGGGNSVSASAEDGSQRNGLPFPKTPLGSHIASNKESTSLHPFEQGGPPHPHN